MQIRMEAVLLALVAAIGLLYWNVTLNTPIVFGDEGWYAAMAEKMISTGVIPEFNVVHDTDIWHYNLMRPPLFFMFNTGALVTGGEFLLKLMLPLPSMLSAFMLFLLLRRLGKPLAGLVAAGVLMLIPGIVTYGVMNYVETLAILFFTSSVYFSDDAFRNGSRKGAIVSGIFAGLALMTEISTLLLLPVLIGYALFLKPLRFRQLVTVLAIAIIFISPWIARNALFFGGHCYFPVIPDFPGACANKLDVQLGETGPEIAAAPTSGGASSSISTMGLLSYSNFAFGWTVATLMIFGTVALFTSGRARLVIGLWLAVLFMMTFWQANTGRAEDAVRNTLFGFPALAAVTGLFVSSAYDWLVIKNRWISLAVVALILLALVPYGYEKLVTMQTVKHNLDGLVDGCTWVRGNTPQSSMIFVMYEHQTAWQCRRTATSSVPDRNAIWLNGANVSYSHLKQHGFDYVMVEQFTVSDMTYAETTPASFVNMLENTPDKFRKVYDNTGKWGQAGVRVFQLL